MSAPKGLSFVAFPEISLDERQQAAKRRRNERDRRYRSWSRRQWTRCPRCGVYLGWFPAHGLKGRMCSCGHWFTGHERNPIARRATTSDGVVHRAWVGSEQRSTVHLDCEIRMRGLSAGVEVEAEGRPCPPDTAVTCMLCLSFEGDE